jgi:hypothetical protein
VILDRKVLYKFPMVTVRALECIERLSDHAPILLTTGTLRPLHKHPFKFELGWLQREGFHDMVKKVWERPVSGNSPIVRWNNKMCAMLKHLSGWLAMSSVFSKKRSYGCHLSLIISRL